MNFLNRIKCKCGTGNYNLFQGEEKIGYTTTGYCEGCEKEVKQTIIDIEPCTEIQYLRVKELLHRLKNGTWDGHFVTRTREAEELLQYLQDPDNTKFVNGVNVKDYLKK